MFVKACDQKNKDKITQKQILPPRIPNNYSSMKSLSAEIKFLPKRF